jgi:predicted ArsR family transcriptional regulator
LTSEELEELRLFLRENVAGFEQLELLLFFARSERRAFSSHEIAAALKLPQEAVRGALEDLARTGHVTPISSGDSVSHRYAPSREFEQQMEKLRTAYDEQPVLVLQLMSTNAIERLRSAAARRLADAFHLDRRKK